MFQRRAPLRVAAKRIAFPWAMLAGVLIVALSVVTTEAGWRNLFRRDDGPELRAVACGRYVVISDHDLPVGTAASIARELDTLHVRLERELGPGKDGSSAPDAPSFRVTRDTQLRIYLFATHEEFSSYVREHIPYLTRADMHRNAMFLLRNGSSYVFAMNTDDLIENLRHEYVHVYLNGAIPDVPVWLDEGLAQYYETDREDGRNERAVAILNEALRGRWSPNLARLERLETMSEMGPREYAEAWSWVAAAQEADPQLIPSFLVTLKSPEDATTFDNHLAAQTGDPDIVWSAWWQRASANSSPPLE